jgi:hypothetical protein
MEFRDLTIANHLKWTVLLAISPVRCASCGPVHLVCERACCTISTKTLRVSAALRTSCKKAMRTPRMPSGVFKRT